MIGFPFLPLKFFASGAVTLSDPGTLLEASKMNNLTLHRVVKIKVVNRVGNLNHNEIYFSKDLLITDDEGNTFEITLFSDEKIEIGGN